MSRSEFDLGSVESEMHVELPRRPEEMEVREPLESGSSLEGNPQTVESVESVIGHSSSLPCLLRRYSHSHKMPLLFHNC